MFCLNEILNEHIPFTFTMIDLDNFKHINDNFGHPAGDHVLKYVSKKIAEAADGFGIAGRFGGDELLLVDLKNIEAGQKEAFFENLYTRSGAFRNNIDLGTGSALIMRFGTGKKDQGYIVCAVERSYRIWQDNECAILYYLAGLLV